jgi:hypothetical protein
LLNRCNVVFCVVFFFSLTCFMIMYLLLGFFFHINTFCIYNKIMSGVRIFLPCDTLTTVIEIIDLVNYVNN